MSTSPRRWSGRLELYFLSASWFVVFVVYNGLPYTVFVWKTVWMFVDVVTTVVVKAMTLVTMLVAVTLWTTVDVECVAAIVLASVWACRGRIGSGTMASVDAAGSVDGTGTGAMNGVTGVVLWMGNGDMLVVASLAVVLAISLRAPTLLWPLVPPRPTRPSRLALSLVLLPLVSSNESLVGSARFPTVVAVT